MRYLLLTSIVFLALTPASYADENAVVLTQTSDFLGKLKTHIGQKGVHLESKRLSLVMTAQAPTWTVTSQKALDKKYFDAPLKEWKKRFALANPKAKKDKQYIAKRGKTGTIAGMKAVQYILATATNWKPGPGYLHHHSEYWVAADLHPPPQVVEILTNAVGLPNESGVPLRIVKYIHGKAVTSLDTVSSTKGVLTTQMLTLPKGYTRVKDEMSFLMGSDGDLDNLLNELGK